MGQAPVFVSSMIIERPKYLKKLISLRHNGMIVCNQGSKRYYIQSAYKKIDDNKVRQEEASLRRIDDSFKKIIILGEYTPVLHDESGITIISIFDFLLQDNSLEL